MKEAIIERVEEVNEEDENYNYNSSPAKQKINMDFDKESKDCLSEDYDVIREHKTSLRGKRDHIIDDFVSQYSQ